MSFIKRYISHVKLVRNKEAHNFAKLVNMINPTLSNSSLIIYKLSTSLSKRISLTWDQPSQIWKQFLMIYIIVNFDEDALYSILFIYTGTSSHLFTTNFFIRWHKSLLSSNFWSEVHAAKKKEVEKEEINLIHMELYTACKLIK